MKIKSFILICLLLSVLFLFSSCEAVDELTGKGVWGWLGVENPFNKESATAVSTGTPITTPEEPNKTEPPRTSESALTPSQTSVPATVTEDNITIPEYPKYEELLAKMSATNMAGKALMISCPTGSSVLTWQNAETANSIIEAVNNKFNTNMFINPQDESEITDNLKSALESDEYAADLLYLPLPLAMEYAKAGYLAEIDISRLSGEIGAYDTDINSAITIDGKTYALSSAISASYENNVVIYINTDLLERLDIELDVYSTVEEKEWTWEMIYMLCSAAKEKNDGSFAISGSLWEKNKTKALLFSSSGMQLSISDKYGDEKADFQKGSFPRFLDEISVFMNGEDFLVGEEAREAFYKGELLLMVGNVGELREHYDSYDSFAILPMPMMDKSQDDYVTVCDPDEVYVFAIPINCENSENILYLLDVMSYVSRYCFKYDFIESLYSVYIRQSQSIPLLGIDHNNRFVPRILAFGDDELLGEIGSQICE